MARRDCKRRSHDYLTVRGKPLWSHKRASRGTHLTSSPKRDFTLIYERALISVAGLCIVGLIESATLLNSQSLLLGNCKLKDARVDSGANCT